MATIHFALEIEEGSIIEIEGPPSYQSVHQNTRQELDAHSLESTQEVLTRNES
jgi:hypothetical protein